MLCPQRSVVAEACNYYHNLDNLMCAAGNTELSNKTNVLAQLCNKDHDDKKCLSYNKY